MSFDRPCLSSMKRSLSARGQKEFFKLSQLSTTDSPFCFICSCQASYFERVEPLEVPAVAADEDSGAAVFFAGSRGSMARRVVRTLSRLSWALAHVEGGLRSSSTPASVDSVDYWRISTASLNLKRKSAMKKRFSLCP